MGLDVHLYQFKNVDTDIVLELSRLTEEPYADLEAFQKWKAALPAERGPFPSKQAVAESREKSLAKAREAGLPDKIIGDYSFGGEQISFQSKKYSGWEVGDWYTLSTIRGIIEHFTGQGLDFVFPEAKSIHGHGFFRPHWIDAKMRLTEILEKLKSLDPGQIDKVRPGLSWSFDSKLNQIGAIIETLDFVLESGNPKEFLLYWSE
jgi:hypothetical protein